MSQGKWQLWDTGKSSLLTARNTETQILNHKIWLLLAAQLSGETLPSRAHSKGALNSMDTALSGN